MSERWWAFRELRLEHEGFYPNDVYKALWNFISDRGYSVFEWRYAKAFISSGVDAAVGIWICTQEIEKKYALSVLDVHWKLVWQMVPKPGSSGENPPMVPKGKVIVYINGALILDYLSTWSKSPLLRPFATLRHNYFYRNRGVTHLIKIRQDGEKIIEDLKQYLNFLPTIR